MRFGRFVRFTIASSKSQIPSTKSQGISKLQSPKQVARLMFGSWFIDPALAGLGLGFWYLEPYRECFSMRGRRSRDRPDRSYASVSREFALRSHAPPVRAFARS